MHVLPQSPRALIKGDTLHLRMLSRVFFTRLPELHNSQSFFSISFSSQCLRLLLILTFSTILSKYFTNPSFFAIFCACVFVCTYYFWIMREKDGQIIKLSNDKQFDNTFAKFGPSHYQHTHINFTQKI